LLKIQIKYGFLWALLAFFTETSLAQVSDSGKTYQGLILDEVMVKAVQQGFDVKGFIAKMKQDTTYYKAFKTLRILGFKMYKTFSYLEHSFFYSLIKMKTSAINLLEIPNISINSKNFKKVFYRY
jgi:squalene cyclase